MRQQPSFNDDDVPLKRREDRWVPVKATSNLDKVLKQVQSIMNKMTTQKFDVLSGQLTEIDMESMEMLEAVIKIIFDKALGEPHFCEMYANLCVRLEQHWQVWSFLQIVHHEESNTWSWTTMSDVDAEVVGPFTSEAELFENAEDDPTDVMTAPEGMQLKEVRVRNGKFIKVWELNGELFWSGQNVEDLGESQVLNGPFPTKEEANLNAIKSTTFKRILLNACQAEFEKDNIYEELEQQKDKAREDGTLTAELEAAFEEKKMLTKQRMLGNIRFIGELFRKGMLQERIMHACILKLLNVMRVPNREDYKIAPLNPKAAPDEESIESLSKLLTTMGKDLEAQHMYPGAMVEYFNYLTYLTKDKRLSSRINFMILDVIDLRKNRWEPRRKELKQKTLEETRKDYEKELASAAKKHGGPPPTRGVVSSTSARDMSQRGGPSSRGGQPPPRSNFNLDKSRSKQFDKPNASGRPASFASVGKGKGLSGGRPPVVEKPAPVKQIADQLAQVSDDTKDLIAKNAKSILEEYVALMDTKEVASCVVELKTRQAPAVSAHLVSSLIVKEGLKLAVEAKDATREGIFDALVFLFEDKQLEADAVKYGLESVILFAPEIVYDVPKINQHLGSIIARLFKLIPSLTLEWLISGIHGDTDALQELVDSGLLCGIVGVFLSQVPPAVAQAQSNAFTSINLTSIFPEHTRTVSDVMDWANKFHLNQALPALYTAGQVYAFAKDSKDVDEVVQWVESNVRGAMRTNSLFTKQACLFLLSLPSWKPYSKLLVGLAGGLDGEMALVDGIVQDVPPAVAWKESSRRNPARDKALAQLGDYIEKLQK
ncbi:hypothetical protein DYB32_001722 [Aphanomyces invadans]|uniref:MI domain-containing protein n=1 Tax=Aphanomyces invadans TaxID=157072 RepID=A0A3R7D541_9STRA|nr:hypothetical protein DYB32_001722 [Aphanomyces invadans]